jgi:parallel beta-helix repeat protein
MALPSRRRLRFLALELLEPRDVPATLLVNSLLDNTTPSDGLVTLREAIAAANGDGTTDLGQTGSGADVIDFDPALFAGGPGTITLGGSDLEIIRSLTITGPGAGTLTVSGNNASRILQIDDALGGPPVDAAITGLTLTGGNDPDGGAIRNWGNLTLTSCSLTGNSADNGGAISNVAARLTMIGCTLSGNSASSLGRAGGALYNVGGGSAALTNCTLSSNMAPAGNGGAIYNEGSGLALTGCTLSSNSASRAGGIHNGFDFGTTTTLTNCTLSGNSAVINGGDGGILNAGTLTLTNCTLSGNSNGGIGNGGTLTLTSCTLSGNSGGGIGNGGTLTLTNCTLSGNSAHHGGAISTAGSPLTLTNCTLSGNSATHEGGAVYVGFSGTATLTNCTLSGNTAGVSGGGLECFETGGPVTLTNCTLSANSATSGGGIHNEGTLTLNNTIVANSTSGGDVVIVGGSTLTGSNNLIEDGSGGLTGTITGDPMLGPLADNGGPTLTHAPLPGSPAIDAGSNAAAAGILTDQRGFTPRVVGGTVDIGSVEVGASAPPPTPLAVTGTIDGAAALFTPTSGQYNTAPSATVSPFGAIPTSVRTAIADVNADGSQDIIVVTGPGVPIRFAVVSGTDNSTVLVPPTEPFPGSGNFLGGGFASGADFDSDGRAEMIFTPDLGGGPRVTIFSLNPDGTLAERASFFGIDDENFRGGARTGTGDVNGDGTPDLAVGAGFQGGPRIALFDGTTLFTTRTKLVNDFFAFEDTLRNGTHVAIGDLNGDGFGDLFFGAGPGGAPRMLAISGLQLLSDGAVSAIASPLANFFVAGNTSDRGGVRVATKDADGDNRADLAVGSGEGSPANVRVYLGVNFTSGGEPSVFQDLSVFGGSVLAGGVFVG